MQIIYKYPVVNGFAMIPKRSQIIRQDHVDDKFYKGYFVWAIVDSSSPREVSHRFEQGPKIDLESLHFLEPIRLRTKEKQSVYCGEAIYAGETDGDINIYCIKNTPKRRRIIALYKTGQEIDTPTERLFYLGLNRLWIIQELGLYTFEVLDDL